MSEFDNRYIDGLGDEFGGRYQLDVDVNTLVFTHHSLFSKEHVLASRLRQMYDQYLKRKQKDVAQYLTEKVKNLLCFKNYFKYHKREIRANWQMHDKGEKQYQDWLALH